jgi:hypothetical protein
MSHALQRAAGMVDPFQKPCETRSPRHIVNKMRPGAITQLMGRPLSK